MLVQEGEFAELEIGGSVDEEVTVVDEDATPDVDDDMEGAMVVVVKLVGIGKGGAIVLSGINTDVPLPGTFPDAMIRVVDVV